MIETREKAEYVDERNASRDLIFRRDATFILPRADFCRHPGRTLRAKDILVVGHLFGERISRSALVEITIVVTAVS